MRCDGCGTTEGVERSEAMDAAFCETCLGGAQSLAGCLQRVESFLRRFVVLTDDQACAIVLWVAHTHAIDAAVVTAYLSVTSPEKRSGKTRLLEVLRLLAANPWLTGGTTKAALVRKVDRDSPCLLLDESDAAFNGDAEYSEALRGVLNNGFSRGKPYTTCVGNSHEVKDFDVFGPKAIAGIGKLPDTVEDRSIPIRLKRRSRSENVERFRERVARPTGDVIAGGLATAIEPLIEELKHAEPELPAELSDRGWDIWEPLLAIADAAGGNWPRCARDAAKRLSGDQESDEETLGVRLLGDIREVLGGEEQIPTQELRGRLRDMEEAPWGGWNDGEGIRPRELANKLRPYGIRSHDLRTDEGTKKGYRRIDFEDAWERYFPPSPASKRDIGSVEPRTAPFQARQEPPMSRIEKSQKPHWNADVADVADRTPEKKETGVGHGFHHLTEAEYVERFRARQARKSEQTDIFGGEPPT